MTPLGAEIVMLAFEIKARGLAVDVRAESDGDRARIVRIVPPEIQRLHGLIDEAVRRRQPIVRHRVGSRRR